MATLASRAAGFVRILVLAAVLGLGSRLLDSYNLANTLPNAVYDLVVGGAMASVIVPMLTRAVLTEPDGGVLYAQRLLTVIGYGLGAVTLVATLVAPVLVDLFAPGFTADQRHLAIVFTRFFLPQILFYGMSAAAGAVLNIRGRFAAPMWAPVANSLIVTAVGLLYFVVGGATSMQALTTPQVLLLSLGTSAGVFAQMALVMSALARSGFPFRPRLDPRGIGMRRIVRLGGWMLLSVAAAQVLFAVATRSASISGPGGISAYQNAYALFQMPFAVITLSVMTVLLPRLSHSAALLDQRRITDDLSLGIRLAVVAIAPLAAAMVALGPQLAAVLFAHGRSDPSAVGLLGTVMAAFGLALVPFSGYAILLRGFYAMQDTRTPALITSGVSVVGVAGCLAAAAFLPGPDIVVGVAVAYGAAYTTGLVTAGLVLRHRLGRIDGRRLAGTHARVLVAAAVAAGVAAALARLLNPLTGPLVVVAAASLLGAIAYVVTARLLRLTELGRLVATATAGIRGGAKPRLTRQVADPRARSGRTARRTG
ncbi:murein biosynthesis integral membrane protein MurJ [Dactylosporangium sp. AC04546]|uniref:murein biosynthesis integral membrane protein MurJ n=1 Tax=Dactylosporangium sp. AC04546 TaxID=2862460 RepID=UPI001EDCF3B7|nr:murein biosynthesis integral membrane protein MurJ [Dactylosporangium sp. AC04546]WVK88832.1 murein biosynthesis integral membrane protein MurJ [Dactylosporangium sp. AC04546]